MSFSSLFSTEDSFKSYSKIYLWSDGGLKTKENLFYLSILGHHFKLNMEVNFFAPYHGEFFFFSYTDLFFTYQDTQFVMRTLELRSRD
jgi:hypothetical protein